MCTLDAPNSVVMGYKDLINRPIHPDLLGPPKPGRIYFTGKIHTNLTQGQKIRTGSDNPDSRRKNQKSRPWVVLYVRKDGNFSVISLTTRNNKIWAGLEGNDVNSFLPLGSTPGFPGRCSVEILSNTCGIFKGTSLIFLEVERVVPASSLGHPVGEITPEGLKLVREERDLCAEYWRRQARERQVYTGHWKRQPYIPRPLNPTNVGHTRVATSSTEQQLNRGQFERGQFGRGQFGRGQSGGGQAGRFQPERGQFGRDQFKRDQVGRGLFERGQVKTQNGVTENSATRRWSV